MSNRYKLRIKDASGAEFEAEGPIEFIQSEKALFLDAVRPKTSAEDKARPRQGHARKPGESIEEDAFWPRIIASSGDSMSLRIKSPEIKAAEAALVLLAANRALNRTEDMRAIDLAKALRASGYQPDRLDRLLNREACTGKITASGTKRNRTYRITQKGLGKIYGTIAKLTGDDIP